MDDHCAWCNPSDNGTDNICDECMVKYFNVDPASIHAEIAAEENQSADQSMEATR